MYMGSGWPLARTTPGRYTGYTNFSHRANAAGVRNLHSSDEQRRAPRPGGENAAAAPTWKNNLERTFQGVPSIHPAGALSRECAFSALSLFTSK